MTNHNNNDAAVEQELANLRKQHEDLKSRRIRTEEQIRGLSAQLEELQNRAVEEFGTADPEQLAALLQERRDENARLVAEYREHIQKIQAGLADLNKDMGQQ